MKNIEDLIKYWLKSAEEDHRVMQHLFDAGDYSYSLFFGHLVLEKTLKAYFVKINNEHAPYTHSLTYLSEKSNLNLTSLQLSLLEEVNQFNLEARYPDKKFEFYKICTKDFTSSYIAKIEEFYKWLLTQI